MLPSTIGPADFFICEMQLQPADFVKIAADRDRLAVLGRLALGPARPAELAATLGISERDVLRRLGRLGAGGLVREEAGVFHLDEAVLRELAAAAGESRAAHPAVLAGLDPEEAEVAQRFFRGQRLVEIPAAPAKRLAVLRILADEFDPGRYYAESDVRRILRRFHPDDAALRRYMVEEGVLQRDNRTRTYWRGGGPAPDGGPPSPA
jgi:hypothetical protein